MGCGRAWAEEKEQDFEEYAEICKKLGLKRKSDSAFSNLNNGWEKHYSYLKSDKFKNKDSFISNCKD